MQSFSDVRVFCCESFDNLVHRNASAYTARLECNPPSSAATRALPSYWPPPFERLGARLYFARGTYGLWIHRIAVAAQGPGSRSASADRRMQPIPSDFCKQSDCRAARDASPLRRPFAIGGS